MSEPAGAASGVLTVRELLYHSGLGLTAVTGDVGLGRVIKGVHFSDADDPVPYLTSESVLINTGRTWYEHPAVGRVGPGAPREHRHRGAGGRAGALPGRGPGRGGGARARNSSCRSSTLPPGALTRNGPLLRLQRARLRGPAPSAPHGRPAERPARPADRGGGCGRAAGQGGGAPRHADAAARRGRRRGHELGRAPTPRAARARCGRRGPSSRTRVRSASSRWATRGTSAARSCSTARWNGSSSRRRRTPRAPSSSTRRCRSSSA